MAWSFCAESIRKACEWTEGVEDVDVSLAHEEASRTTMTASAKWQ